jgi:hypothetical protein
VLREQAAIAQPILTRARAVIGPVNVRPSPRRTFFFNSMSAGDWANIGVELRSRSILSAPTNVLQS